MEQNTQQANTGKNWYDKSYIFLMLIPVIALIFSIAYMFNLYSETGEFINKDVSLKGGTTITINGDVDSKEFEDNLRKEIPDVSFKDLSDLRTGKKIALIIESDSDSEELKSAVEKVLGYNLTDDNSSVEFTGSALSGNFYRQLIMALVISFVLMSCVIFIMFRTFIPSASVIFAVFANLVFTLTFVDYLGIKISAAGIAAFLMLIGYSVDTNILLTTRALKKREGTLNQRIYGAFKTGIFMTFTALAAVLPAFLIVTGLPDSFRQIFLILSCGLTADIFTTWLTNTGIIKLYCKSKGIN